MAKRLLDALFTAGTNRGGAVATMTKRLRRSMKGNLRRLALTPLLGRLAGKLADAEARQLAWRFADLPVGAADGRWWIEHPEERLMLSSAGAVFTLKRRGSLLQVRGASITVCSVLEMQTTGGQSIYTFIDAAGMMTEEGLVLTGPTTGSYLATAREPTRLPLAHRPPHLVPEDLALRSAVAALLIVLGVPEMLSVTAPGKWEHVAEHPRWRSVDDERWRPFAPGAASPWFADGLAAACADQEALIKLGYLTLCDKRSHRQALATGRSYRTFIAHAERLLLADTVTEAAADLAGRLDAAPEGMRRYALLPFPAMLLEFNAAVPASIGLKEPGRYVLFLMVNAAERSTDDDSPRSDAVGFLFAESATQPWPVNHMDVHIGSEALPFLNMHEEPVGGITDPLRFGTFLLSVLHLLTLPRGVAITSVRSPQNEGTSVGTANDPPTGERWRMVTFAVDGATPEPDGHTGDTGTRGGSGRALHCVRAFLRHRKGRIEAVRAHLRGNPTLGLERKGYHVVTAADKRVRRRRTPRRQA